MPFITHTIAIVLAVLACAGHGRRAQKSESLGTRNWELENIAHLRAGEFNDAELGMANLKKALHDPSLMSEVGQMFRDPKTLAEIKEMMADPNFQQQAKRVAPKNNALKSFATLLESANPSAAFNPVSAGMSRRDVTTSAAAAAAALFTSPLTAVADGASSAATQARARQVYGSRIFRLQSASAEKILSEKPAFALFLNAYGKKAPEDRATVTALKKLNGAALAAAAKGDAGAATAAIKDIVKVGAIKELDTIDDAIFNPLMKRNLGSPVTEEMEDLLADRKGALYDTGSGKVEPANLLR